MKPVEPESPRWPLRLRDLSRELQSGGDSSDRQQVRGEIWAILSHALQRYMEAKRSMSASLAPEDIEDLASDKSMHLFRNLESGRWVIGDRSGPEIAGFIATTAQNAIIDWLRRPGRRRPKQRSDPADPRCEDLPMPPDAPDSPCERREFIKALRGCVETLQPRSRRIWFFRLFYSLSSKEIGAHPQVALKPERVDEMLYNIRRSLSRCMEARGQRLRELPTGTFFEIWTTFRGSSLLEVQTDGRTFDVSC